MPLIPTKKLDALGKMSALARTSRWVSRFKILHSQSTLFRTFSSSSSYSSTTRTANKDEDPGPPAPPPIRVSLTESAGRAVFATRRIGAGDLIHTAKPLVAHPSLFTIHSVCYFCLRKLKATSQTQAIQFCNKECEEQSKVFYNVERRANWSAYDNYCRTHGLKYPLLVKRLACMVISGVAAADSLDILQPANLSPEIVSELEEGFGLLRSAFTKANIFDEQTWYTSVLARIRINAFRVEVAGGLYEDLLSSAAASIEAEAAVGNAVYMLPSFYNHDCDPNAHILWIDNADARLKVLRDIEEKSFGSAILMQV